MEIGETAQQGGQCGAAFETGEWGADAVVDAMSVAEVLVVPAGEVECVRLVETGGITVGGGEDHEYGITGSDVLFADFEGLGRVAPGGQFDRAVVSEELFDAGVEQFLFATFDRLL